MREQSSVFVAWLALRWDEHLRSYTFESKEVLNSQRSSETLLCSFRSHKNLVIWSVSSLPMLFRKRLGEEVLLPGLLATWTWSSHSFEPNTPKSPAALVWGLILRISKIYRKPFYVQPVCLMEKATGGRGIQATPSHQCGLMDVETGPCLGDETCDSQHTVITETWKGKFTWGLWLTSKPCWRGCTPIRKLQSLHKQ